MKNVILNLSGKVFLGCLILFFASSLSAQNWQTAFEIGGNTAYFNYSNADEISKQSQKLRFNMGVLKERKLNDDFALLFGARYAMLSDGGAFYSYSPGLEGPAIISGDFVTTMHTLAFPFKLKYNFPNQSAFFSTVGAEFGVFPKVMLNTKYHIVSSPGNGTFERDENTSYDLSDEFDRRNYSLNFGVGYNFSMYAHNTYVLAHYSFGLNKINNSSYSRLLGYERRINEFALNLGFVL